MSKNNKKVSAIMCAYNEERHIEETLKDLLKCSSVGEIIVVNDGSKDKTLEILKKYKDKIKLISYKKNRGKGFALYTGIRASNGEIVVFLDAHLKNLKDKHIKKLTEPILAGKANYVLARRNSKYEVKMISNLTGERAYLKQILLPYLSHIKNTKFGVETYLNEIFKPRWGKIIYFSDLTHLMKREKMASEEVVPDYIREILEISKTKLEIRTDNHKQLKKILNPKKIKNLRSLQKKVDEIADREISDLIKAYIIPSIRKLSNN